MSLVSCPPEVVIHVLENLRGDQIARCASVRRFTLNHLRHLSTWIQVCSLFRSLIDASMALQYKILLSKWHYLDLLALPASDNVVTSADCVEILRRHEFAWAGLKWTHVIDLPFKPNHPMSLHGNLISWIGTEGDSTKLFLSKLPSSLRHVPIEEFGNQPLSFDLGIPGQLSRSVVYKIDASQDLLVTINRQEFVIYHVFSRAETRSLATRSD
jgi:hypothetical protein